MFWQKLTIQLNNNLFLSFIPRWRGIDNRSPNRTIMKYDNNQLTEGFRWLKSGSVIIMHNQQHKNDFKYLTSTVIKKRPLKRIL